MKKYGKQLAAVLIIVLALLAYWGARSAFAEKTKPQAETQSSTSENLAADFSVTDAEDHTVSLSDFRGKPVIINFWATWCGPCRSELGYFNELSGEYGDEVQFMMVDLTDGTSDTIERVKAFAEENGYTFPVYFDVNFDAVKAYGISSIPMTVMVDAEGNLIGTHMGAMNRQTIENYLKEIIGNEQ